jgi:hypothetical protein
LALLPVDCALSQLLKQTAEWRVLADDGKRILFEKRASKVVTSVVLKSKAI